MKNITLKLAVLAALSVSAQAQAAAGFVALPDTGFSSSAYTNCFNDGRTSSDPKGNFGSHPIPTANLPTSSQNNTCWVAKPSTELVAPKAGYTIAGARTVTIPTQTGGAGNIGTLLDYAWRINGVRHLKSRWNCHFSRHVRHT